MPDRRQRVQTRMRRTPPFTMALTVCRFGSNRRALTLWAWLMVGPRPGPCHKSRSAWPLRYLRSPGARSGPLDKHQIIAAARTPEIRRTKSALRSRLRPRHDNTRAAAGCGRHSTAVARLQNPPDELDESRRGNPRRAIPRGGRLRPCRVNAFAASRSSGVRGPCSCADDFLERRRNSPARSCAGRDCGAARR